MYTFCVSAMFPLSPYHVCKARAIMFPHKHDMCMCTTISECGLSEVQLLLGAGSPLCSLSSQGLNFTTCMYSSKLSEGIVVYASSLVSVCSFEVLHNQECDTALKLYTTPLTHAWLLLFLLLFFRNYMFLLILF